MASRLAVRLAELSQGGVQLSESLLVRAKGTASTLAHAATPVMN